MNRPLATGAGAGASASNKPSKVKRYWPGKREEEEDDDEDEEEEEQEEQEEHYRRRRRREESPSLREGGTRVVSESKVVAQSQPGPHDGDDRLISHGDADEDDDNLEERRRRARARAQLQSEKPDQTADGEDGAGSSGSDDDSGSESDGSSDEDESDDDEEEEDGDAGRRGPLLKPVFIPSRARKPAGEPGDGGADDGTAAAHDAEKPGPDARASAAEARKERTRAEVAVLMERELQYELQTERENAAGFANKEDVNTDDDAGTEDGDQGGGEAELASIIAWEERERSRILRDWKWRHRHAQSVAGDGSRFEKSKGGTLREIEASFREFDGGAASGGAGTGNGRAAGGKDKEKWAFMQRYYHKGAFFQDDADDAFAAKTIRKESGDVLDRDYSAARTGEDKINFEALPEVMRVRKWGKVGRTKWTHLSNEDTSRLDDPYYRMRNQVNASNRQGNGHNSNKRRRDDAR